MLVVHSIDSSRLIVFSPVGPLPVEVYFGVDLVPMFLLLIVSFRSFISIYLDRGRIPVWIYKNTL